MTPPKARQIHQRLQLQPLLPLLLSCRLDLACHRQSGPVGAQEVRSAADAAAPGRRCGLPAGESFITVAIIGLWQLLSSSGSTQTESLVAEAAAPLKCHMADAP